MDGMASWRDEFGLIVSSFCWWNVFRLALLFLADIVIHDHSFLTTGIFIHLFPRFQLGPILTLPDHKVNKIFDEMQTLNWELDLFLIDEINGQINQLEL